MAHDPINSPLNSPGEGPTIRHPLPQMYPGGMRWRSITEVQVAHPERVVIHAVRGMLPKNKLGRAMIKKLKVYGGPEHPHRAQGPKPLPLA